MSMHKRRIGRGRLARIAIGEEVFTRWDRIADDAEEAHHDTAGSDPGPWPKVASNARVRSN